MTRATLTAACLLLASSAQAVTLYKWAEADGSITFSTEPPAAGTRYETVNGGASGMTSPAASAVSAPAPATGAATTRSNTTTEFDAGNEQAAQAAIDAAVSQRLQRIGGRSSPVGPDGSDNDSKATAARAGSTGIRATAPAKVSVSAPARISYAPEVSGNGSSQRGARSPAGSGASHATAASAASSRTPPMSPDAIAARNKRNRCDDLRKRVVSLERRLRLDLTPGDMDNTVIHMARYQKSFDQFCAD
ncbi:MAG: hypothetical protein CSB44_12320 [Gammaproteobacteria bacterium]|nr:MAG: hypothetical protein CSB44_12320 [Gammaproteobacteria bacterium]